MLPSAIDVDALVKARSHEIAVLEDAMLNTKSAFLLPGLLFAIFSAMML